MIDHDHGGWYRVLAPEGRKYSEEKSIAGGKCDYHTMGACYEVIRRGL
jgi:mannose/cellobiose epimerase-like protein (N-acyl-D-glucosamine 2-epimerase family)